MTMTIDDLRNLSGRERLLRIFEARVYSDRFVELSGWDHPIVTQEFSGTCLTFGEEEASRYIFDREQFNPTLEKSKDIIAAHLTEREQQVVQPSAFLLVPGATAALTVVMHFLQARGAEVIITDPPYYFSMERVAQALGIRFVISPRTSDDLSSSCEDLFTTISRFKGTRKAIVLSQPRYVLSRNYPRTILDKIHSMLDADDYLVVDQSTDLEFSNEDNLPVASHTLKIRSIGKAISVNGARLAVLMAHDEETIAKMNAVAGYLYGSLDVAMLKLGTLLVADSARFRRQLRAVQTHVHETYRAARGILSHPGLCPIEPQNGFLGAVLINTEILPRYAMYQYLLRRGAHALFSSQVGLRQSYSLELLRVNYLLGIEPALRMLANCAAYLSPRPRARAASTARSG